LTVSKSGQEDQGAQIVGWPLVIDGSLKATYDLILLRMFRKVRPPKEN
jgi:hypothetical protein